MRLHASRLPARIIESVKAVQPGALFLTSICTFPQTRPSSPLCSSAICSRLSGSEEDNITTTLQRSLGWLSTDMASHSCHRCSWLVLKSDVHSPDPAISQSIAIQLKRLHPEYRDRGDSWYFVWPLRYNVGYGECGLLQAMLPSEDVSRDMFLIGRLDPVFFYGSESASLWLHVSHTSFTEHTRGTHASFRSPSPLTYNVRSWNLFTG